MLVKVCRHEESCYDTNLLVDAGDSGRIRTYRNVHTHCDSVSISIATGTHPVGSSALEKGECGILTLFLACSLLEMVICREIIKHDTGYSQRHSQARIRVSQQPVFI